MHDVSYDSTTLLRERFVTFNAAGALAGAVKIGSAWLLLEAGQAPLSAQRAVEHLAAIQNGGAAAATIVTTPATGNGGVAWLTSHGITVHVAPGAAPFINAVLSGHETHGTKPRIEPTPRWIRLGGDSLWVEPIDFADAPGAMVVYVPSLDWAYSGLAANPVKLDRVRGLGRAPGLHPAPVRTVPSLLGSIYARGPGRDICPTSASDRVQTEGRGWRVRLRDEHSDRVRCPRAQRRGARRNGGVGITSRRKNHRRTGHRHTAGFRTDPEHHREFVHSRAQGRQRHRVHPGRSDVRRLECTRIQHVVQQSPVDDRGWANRDNCRERTARRTPDDHSKGGPRRHRDARRLQLCALWPGCLERSAHPRDEGSQAVSGMEYRALRRLAQLL